MNIQNGNANGKAEDIKCDFYHLLKYTSQKNIFKSSFHYHSKVAKELPDIQPYYTIDFADVLCKIQLWKKQMPYIRPYYAVKSNSDPVLLRFLVLLGFSFDCATEGEIRYVLEAGGNTENIIFAHVIKAPGSLQYASSVGVDFLTFDSAEELLKIHKYHPKSRLILRLSPEDVRCSFDLSDKFGCKAKDAKSVLKIAKDLGLNVDGVSFHVGGLCKNPNSYSATIRASREVFDVAKELGFKFTTLDIGGGFSGSTGSEALFLEITQVIHSALKENFPDPDIEIIAEPGTFFVCSAVTLNTTIWGKKQRNNQHNGINGINSIQRSYYVNDSIYGSFFKGVEQYGLNLKPLLDETEVRRRPVYNSTVWGQTCCGEDMLVQECKLSDLEEGECILWKNMGAYSRVLCSNFCGVPYPATKHVFINKPRLNFEWLSNPNQIIDFISKACYLIETE